MAACFFVVFSPVHRDVTCQSPCQWGLKVERARAVKRRLRIKKRKALEKGASKFAKVGNFFHKTWLGFVRKIRTIKWVIQDVGLCMQTTIQVN